MQFSQVCLFRNRSIPHLYTGCQWPKIVSRDTVFKKNSKCCSLNWVNLALDHSRVFESFPPARNHANVRHNHCNYDYNLPIVTEIKSKIDFLIRDWNFAWVCIQSQYFPNTKTLLALMHFWNILCMYVYCKQYGWKKCCFPNWKHIFYKHLNFKIYLKMYFQVQENVKIIAKPILYLIWGRPGACSMMVD